jgi:hypothetical protein
MSTVPKPDERMADAVLLFRFSVPIRKRASLWSAKGADLPEECVIPNFGQLDQKPVFANCVAVGAMRDSRFRFV